MGYEKKRYVRLTPCVCRTRYYTRATREAPHPPKSTHLFLIRFHRRASTCTRPNPAAFIRQHASARPYPPTHPPKCSHSDPHASTCPAPPFCPISHGVTGAGKRRPGPSDQAALPHSLPIRKLRVIAGPHNPLDWNTEPDHEPCMATWQAAADILHRLAN